MSAIARKLNVNEPLYLRVLSVVEQKSNKKVLLHERKRHTARRAASVRCGDLSLGGGVPTLAGGYLPWSGYPLRGVDRQTPVKTVPSRILGVRAVTITVKRLVWIGYANWTSLQVIMKLL